jgi:hypothetical protein
MLELIGRGRAEDRRPLEAEEGAFGRYALRAARAAGTQVVHARQPGRGGQWWFACDYLRAAPSPSVLVPVAEMHVPRHVEDPWSEHCDTCDFFHEPEEQRAISASFARLDPSGGLHLVRGFELGWPHKRGVMRASFGRMRSGLARCR